MYTVITNKKKIASAQKTLIDRLHTSLPYVDGEFTIGHQGANFLLDDLRSNGIIWFGSFTDKNAKVPRFWHGFGLSSQLVISGSNSIVTEANVALDGMHPKAKNVAAILAEDNQGNIILIHTGK